MIGVGEAFASRYAQARRKFLQGCASAGLAVHSYVGYDAPISRLRTHVGSALEQVDMLEGRQGALIETVAINELKARAERLEAYQSQARYAVADSYDRATKAQAEAAGAPQ